MEIGLAAVAAQLLVIFIFSKIIIYIDLRYKRNQADDYVAINIFMGRNILLYSMKVPVIEIVQSNSLPWLESEIKAADRKVGTHVTKEKRFIKNAFRLYLMNPRKFWQVLHSVKYYTRLYQKVMIKVANSLTCERLLWKTKYGSEDAALTGLMGGSFWAFKGMLVTVLKRRFVFTSHPEIAITPVFGQACFEVDFQCIFSLRLGKVINAMAILLNKRGKGAATSGGTSYSRANEDSNGKHKRYG